MRRGYLLSVVLSLAAIGIALVALLMARGGGSAARGLKEITGNLTRGAHCDVSPVVAEPFAKYLAEQLGLDAQIFEYSMPAGVRLTAWLEVYSNGALDRKLSRYFYVSKNPKGHSGRSAGSFAFRRYYPKYSSESAPERCRWEFTHFGQNERVVEWVDNPFKDIMSSGSVRDSARPELGETKIIYYNCGQTKERMEKDYRGYPFFVDEAELLELVEHNDVCVFIKVRFDKSDDPGVLYGPAHGLPEFLSQE